MPNVKEIRLDGANGKTCQRQCMMLASEYVCGSLIENRLSA